MTAAAKIGLFMLIGLIILGAFIIKIEDIPIGERGERTTYNALFPSVAGVDEKAAVRIAGVRVGKVESVRLEGAEAVVEMSLEPDIALHEGASAAVSSLGMLGEKYIEVLPGNPGAPVLSEGATIPGVTPPTIDDVMRTATSIGEDVKEVTAALRQSIGGDQGADKIAEIVDNIRELTASLKELVRENQANVNATTDNFRQFSADLREELPRVADKLAHLADQLGQVVGENREDVQASVENIRELTTRLQTTADNLNTITGKMARGEGTVGKLLNDETTVDNLNDTLDAIEGGVASLQNTIGRMERYRLEMNIRGEALPELADGEGRTAFGFDLWTTEDRFWRVEAVDTPFGVTDSETIRTTTIYPDGTEETIVTERITTEDEIAFSAQVGFRVFDGTNVRLGLIESSGGIGVDQQLDVGGSKPLLLTFEAYDFNNDLDRDPHLRFATRYHLTPRIFLSAGWDDPLESDRSSYLLGGGITWTDEDVKYLLGLAGSAIN